MPLSIQTNTVGPIAVNCYLVGDPESKRAIVIDPGAEPERILADIDSGGWNVASIVATHAHFDHVLAVEEVKKATGAQFLLHPNEVVALERVPEVALRWLGIDADTPPQPDRMIVEGDLIEIGDFSLSVAETPGHSPGGICLIGDGEAFVGDIVFEGSIGRTDFPGSDYETLMKSIGERILPLEGSTVLYPGHGPPTTVARERNSNPFFLQHFG